jgi:hypothetical protein
MNSMFSCLRNWCVMLGRSKLERTGSAFEYQMLEGDKDSNPDYVLNMRDCTPRVQDTCHPRCIRLKSIRTPIGVTSGSALNQLVEVSLRSGKVGHDYLLG